ncbi:hypothetical protein PGT21_023144 [Puccinia graminis f. sp. tritici]|uniref:Uncharacterized protein n=1 Tax=Puccinia graminis f. sp. tritici TaxID=56615 RepID=A0A5B0PU52_PUCGR|nr:hypothetical protein PGTUg99_027701 [Puccinia graminis f. sp. tritici]KAA1104426.1 hypothetical protein PGT21_023144 [Puccinia graminis f. sp. tritici]
MPEEQQYFSPRGTKTEIHSNQLPGFDEEQTRSGSSSFCSDTCALVECLDQERATLKPSLQQPRQLQRVFWFGGVGMASNWGHEQVLQQAKFRQSA